MNTFNIFIALLILLVAGASADQCSASVTAAPRKDSSPWITNGVTYTIYDISVVNTGSCAITALYAYFGYPAGTTISSTFNYESSSGKLSGFGDSIASSATYPGAGFILAGSGTPTIAFIRPTCPCTTVPTTAAPTTAAPTRAPTLPTVAATPAPIFATVRPTDAPTSSNCFQSCKSSEVCVALDENGYSCHPRDCKDLQCPGSTCINDGGVARCIGGAPSTSAPTTSAPTTPAPATAAPTSAPVPTSSPTGSATCSVSATLVARRDGEFNDANGVANKIFDLVVTSKGASAVSGLQITFSLATGSSIAQKWNLQQVGTSATYNVMTYGALNTNGAEYHGSGFAIAGSTATPSISIAATCA